ncbi:Spo0E family sporulation regulatory protein-aspartic acid phosphatase [Clostridium sp. HV4-5-A1G]|uniref:Spo0E family sporulation regulatory protein-aspartic acid phosphatase n=1 Tax=Clostridium sp. HV4-5-A1G TaxID=2004595 RepID=UPI001239428E|nr:Spo0E family sporulation regulatory protein-aspartic acid phosphatase [Clostridium sp. HV4-5-A1G]KAA8666392.1 Spo0E family sporulation regulatory protein-aspartic acid phosphatase [Clostridium sp. HV4-5-A1G]
MGEIKDRLMIKGKIENLREKLNNDIIKNIEYKDIEKNKDILAASEELDNIIVDYIKNFNQEI